MENIVGRPHNQLVCQYMIGFSALNFTLPVRAGGHGHALQTANRFSVFTI